jgi:hypothetical protein
MPSAVRRNKAPTGASRAEMTGKAVSLIDFSWTADSLVSMATTQITKPAPRKLGDPEEAQLGER